MKYEIHEEMRGLNFKKKEILKKRKTESERERRERERGGRLKQKNDREIK